LRKVLLSVSSESTIGRAGSNSMSGNGNQRPSGGIRIGGSNRGPREPQPDEHSCIDVLDPQGLAGSAICRWLMERSTAALRHLGCRGEVRVRIVGDGEMAAAHERYSGIPGTTDVLTFDLRDDPAAGGALDTDILVCIDEARREAGHRGLSVERELLLYIVHGVLHCLGYDDHDEAGHAAMHDEEDRVLEAIGVGRTFASPARPEASA